MQIAYNSLNIRQWLIFINLWIAPNIAERGQTVDIVDKRLTNYGQTLDILWTFI